MISRLRRKFIIIAMLSVTAVLAVLIASINIFNYRNVTVDADILLDMLSSNEGEFPDMMMQPPSGDHFGGHFDRRKDQMSPEMRYEARFFTIELDKDGEVLSVDTGRIAAIDSSEAAALAEKVYSGGRTKGYSGDYRYLRTDNDDVTLIVFYDCGRSLDNAGSFLRTSIVISVLGLVIVFVLIALTSKVVVKPAAEAYEKQKRFITDAGHELKTPLAVINADVEVLGMENGDNEWIEDIRKQTQRLTDLTQRLIYLAKTEEGSKKSITKIDFPLSDCVAEMTESFRGLAKASGRSIDSDIKPGIILNGDQKAIEELISVVMDNAVKYSPEGSSVKVSLAKSGSKVIFKVYNDTEEPVAKEEAELMFDRFYRADKSRNSGTGGYGIGLSIAKSIVEVHGGKIYASPAEKGITVTAEF